MTDITPGYDHITSAMGAAMDGWNGTTMLCYVTPKENLSHPNAEDVHEELIAYQIATKAGDIANHRAKAKDRDDELSRARYNLDWTSSLCCHWIQAHQGISRQTLPVEIYKQADICSQCAPKHCTMQTKITDENLEDLKLVLKTQIATGMAGVKQKLDFLLQMRQ